MGKENYQKVKDIFVDVVQQKPEVRQAFLKEACNGDAEIHREVESLLSSFDSADSFLEMPAVVEVAESFVDGVSQLECGQTLKHYEIIRQIGKGGMGEVYLAKDTKLHRQVALKVLLNNFTSEKKGNERLLREARTAATLDHPNICAIYEIAETSDYSFIVMQYVEGETLAEKLENERLGIETSLDLAIQIADALKEAHAKHIIHRDIKPANIIINEKSQVKVLDFGLAKVIEVDSEEETIKNLNSSRAVMGTVPYMSPEQLCGKQLDTCTDIFSFGAMFYEMLTGQKAFSMENDAETISAVLNDEPDWAKIPKKLQPIVQKSLIKNKEGRYQTVCELIRDLCDVQQSGELLPETDDEFTKPRKSEMNSTPSPGQAYSRQTSGFLPKSGRFLFWRSSRSNERARPETERVRNAKTIKSRTSRLGLPSILSALIFFLLIGTAVWLVWQFSRNNDTFSFESLHPVRLVSWKSGANSAYFDYRLSNSGKLLAYSSTQNGENEGIYVKQTADGEEIRITNDKWINHSPIWSPDDQRIAFVSVREGLSGIYASSYFGGTKIPLKFIGKGKISLRHWSKDGTTIFYELQGNLFRLDMATRETSQISNFAASPYFERKFSFAPNEDRIAFCDNREGQEDIWVMSLKDDARVRLTNSIDREMSLRWHPDGERILYTLVREDDHYQINLAYVDGRPPQQITRGDGEYKLIDISADGTKIFYTSWEKRSDISSINIESGEEFEVTKDVDPTFWADVSPDGRSILYQTNVGPNLSVFMYKSSIAVKSFGARSPRLSLKGYIPQWLPDSRQIAFLRGQEIENKYNLWLVNTINGEEKQITREGIYPVSYSLLPRNRGEISNFDWSPDSRQVVYLDSKRQNVLMGFDTKSETINQTNNNDPNLRYASPLWSPDGNRFIYLLTETPSDKIEKEIWSIWLKEQGDPKKIYTTTGSLRLLGWSASGNEIFLDMTEGPMKSDPLDVKLLQVSVIGEDRVISTFKNIYALSMTLSTDGKTVAYTARQDDKDDIWIAATNGGEPKKITANGNSRLFYGGLTWTPDGKTILFDKQNQIITISMFENFR